MVSCHDPRHETPCPNPHACSACMQECETRYWLEDDGTPWGDVGLVIAKPRPRGRKGKEQA